MTCADARDLVLAHARGALPPGDDAAVREHLASCAACARVDHVDRMLSEVLEQRLPQHPASLALKRRLAAGWPAPRLAPTSLKLFVVRADGLDWPARRLEMSSRGFRVIVWRAGELGYALVSDVSAGELRTLAAKVMGEPA